MTRRHGQRGPACSAVPRQCLLSRGAIGGSATECDSRCDQHDSYGEHHDAEADGGAAREARDLPAPQEQHHEGDPVGDPEGKMSLIDKYEGDGHGERREEDQQKNRQGTTEIARVQEDARIG